MQYLSVKSDSVMLHLKQKADSLDEVEVRSPCQLGHVVVFLLKIWMHVFVYKKMYPFFFGF